MLDKVLSIVIPVFNKANFTKSCLNDLSKLPEDHEIIIVNNNSTDDTANVLSDFQSKHNNIVVCLNCSNLGFAKACNIGYGISTAPNVLFLNNDIRVKSNFDTWTQPLIENCADALVGPTMGQLNSELQFVKESNSVLNGNSYLSGWCLASSKEVFKKLEIPRTGLLETPTYIPQIFSEEFGIAYFEDTDMGFRARRLNIPVKVIDVPVVHFGKQTSSQLNTHALYQHARSVFVKKWHRK